jgi:hypothetical protein
LFTTTHCDRAASIECRVGLKQFAPQTTGVVGSGVGVAVGLVKPGGSPIAVGVGDEVVVGVGVSANAESVINEPITANATSAKIIQVSLLFPSPFDGSGSLGLG